MTNLFGGRGRDDKFVWGQGRPCKCFARSFLALLAAGKSAAPNEQRAWLGFASSVVGPLFGKGAPQIPPLRYASVGMTKGRVAVALKNC
jgi:hypothetical protein